MTDYPIKRQTRLGDLSLDQAASGSGWVVSFQPTQAGHQAGFKPRWETFTAKHTAFAFLDALTASDAYLRRLSFRPSSSPATKLSAKRRNALTAPYRDVSAAAPQHINYSATTLRTPRK